jgi:hypothetical protein
MNFQELSQFINHKKVYSYRKFYKHEVLHEKDFEKIKQFFEPTTTIFHLWRPTWRSGERLRHWHAVKYDEFVELHCDFGNINKTYWFGFFHFFVDVLGYSIWCLLRHGKPWHKRDFSHLKKIKTHHPFHLANVFSARVGMCLLDSKLRSKKSLV